MTNYLPGTLSKLGLGYESLAAIRPVIIVLEMPGYGLRGPMHRRVALGPTMEAACGMAALIGYGDGRPVVSGPAYLDPIGGFNAAAAILGALLYRARTGQGQHIEVAQYEAAMHWVGEEILSAVDRGPGSAPRGNAVSYGCPHDAYRCAGDDQWVAIAVSTDRQWQALCEAVGRPDLASSPSVGTMLGRMRRPEEVRQIIESWTSSQTKEQAAEVLQQHGVGAAPVNDGADMARREDLMQAGFFAELGNDEVPTSRYQGLSVGLSRTPGAAVSHAPKFAEHNAAILGRLLGMPADAIERLRAMRVIADEPAGSPD